MIPASFEYHRAASVDDAIEALGHDEDVKLLDQFEEDVPPEAFRHVQVTVLNEAGEKLLVTTHAANPIGKFKPKDHYLDWVLKGLKHWKFPQEVIDQWESYRPNR